MPTRHRRVQTRHLPTLSLLVLALFMAACATGDEVSLRRTVEGQTFTEPINLTDQQSGDDTIDEATGQPSRTITTEVITVDPGTAGRPAQPGVTATTKPGVAVDRNSDRGVTSDTIRIGVFSVLSGGTRFVGEPPYRMTLAYAEDVNRRGGINGRKIEVIGYDVCVSCPEDGLAQAIKAVEQDKIFLAINSYVVNASMGPAQDYLSEKNTPQIEIGNKPVPDSWSYSIGLHLAHRGAIDADAVNKYLEEHNLPKKVATIKFSQSLDNEINRWQKIGLEKHGIEIVAQETVEYGGATMAEQRSQTARMKNAGAEMVVGSHGVLCAFSMTSAEQADWNVPYFCTIMYDDFSLDLAGDSVKGRDVLADSDGLPTVDMPGQAVQEYNRVRNTYYRESDIGVLTLYAFLGMKIFEDAVTPQGDNLTREGVKSFLENMRGYTAGGLVKEINVSPTDHSGVRSALIIKLGEDGTWKRLSDSWVDPDPIHGLQNR